MSDYERRIWELTQRMPKGLSGDEFNRQMNEGIQKIAAEIGLSHPYPSTPVDTRRLATLENAVLTIIKAVQSYLPPDSGVSEKDFISEVIGAVDNPEVYAALHGTSDAGNDSLKRALERGR